jgi:beta-mannanase
LYAFNTDRFSSEQEYLERYPGNEWVDIVGFDIYQKGDILPNEKFINELDKSLTILEKIARSKNKVAALTEFGYNTVPDASWWTNVFFKAIEKHKIAYALAWRNAGKKSKSEVEFYVPYKEQVSAEDFKMFSKLPTIFFENKTKQQKLYQ